MVTEDLLYRALDHASVVTGYAPSVRSLFEMKNEELRKKEIEEYAPFFTVVIDYINEELYLDVL